MSIRLTTLDDAIERVAGTGFCFAPAGLMAPALGPVALAGWPAFADTWNHLETDLYMADGGRYRRRRYATLSAAGAGDAIHLEPHQPHYQGREYNRLNGGVARHFAPIEPQALEHPAMQSALHIGLRLYRRLLPARPAHIELHQFRIEAQAGSAGQPTPEGAHRDGVDFVLVMMVRRHNIASGTTEIFDFDARRVDSFTLTEPGDTAFVDDTRALHGVTPITPVDASQPAWRDVLVATYRAASA